jgi:hypothetical protein
MFYEVKKESAVDFFVIPVSDSMIRVLQGPFYGFGGVAAEASAAFRADDGGESSRLIRWKSVNDDIFNPVRMITRTAAVVVPIARPCEGLVRLWLQWFLVHLVTPHIIRTL